MLGGLTLEERVDLDFTRARRRAFLGRLVRRLRAGSGRDDLLDFEEARKKLRTSVGRNLGRRTVEVERIVGSVGRSADFDGSFMPARARLGEKWRRVDREFHLGAELRLVSLYKVGDDYYVNDGNHRVSVARFHGVEMLDAEVVEFRKFPNATPVAHREPTAIAGKA